MMDFTLELFLIDLSYCKFFPQEEIVWVDNSFSFYLDVPNHKDGNIFEVVLENTTSIHGAFNGYFECITSSGDYHDGGMIQDGLWNRIQIRKLEEAPLDSKNSG